MTEDEATGTADFDLSTWEPDRVRVLLAPAPASVAVARSAVDALLSADREPDCSSNLKLVVSELVSNAVTHTSNGEEIQLVLIRYLRHVHVSVHNGGSAIDLRQFRRGSGDGGRGLDIVAALSEGWSIDTRQTGTTITARVPAPYPASMSEQASELATVMKNIAAAQRTAAVGQSARANVMCAANAERQARLRAMVARMTPRPGEGQSPP